MPTAAIPAAIGLGSSVIGGISGKGAAKRQEKLQREYLGLLKPLLSNQAEAGAFATKQSQPFIRGAGQGLSDLMNKFYKPLAFGSRSAIDAFLSPERRAINQGFESTVANTKLAPRGATASAIVKADMDRQGKLSDLVFNARREGAQGLGQNAQALGSLGTTTLAAGLSGGQQLTSLLNNQAGIAQNSRESAGASLSGIGESLGGFLSSLPGLFGNKRGTSPNDVFSSKNTTGG